MKNTLPNVVGTFSPHIQHTITEDMVIDVLGNGFQADRSALRIPAGREPMRLSLDQEIFTLVRSTPTLFQYKSDSDPRRTFAVFAD